MGKDQKGDKLKKRLKGVRRRKKVKRNLKCDTMAFKMRLVRAREQDER